MNVSKRTLTGIKACAGIALLAGCGNGASRSLLGPAGPLPQSASRPATPDRARSWISHEAVSENLLYVTIAGFNDVFVYSYLPAKVKLVGRLKGFSHPSGECADKKGDIFVTDAHRIREYSHGGTKPIASLSEAGSVPVDCSVDPTNGNLAVSDYSGPTGGEGGVSIYEKARGTPKFHYVTRMQSPEYLAYDAEGNLFVEGYYFRYRSSSCCIEFSFDELPKNHTSRRITLNPPVYLADGVQWDGKYVVVGAGGKPPTIYRFTISGKKAMMVGSVTLRDVPAVQPFWIQGRDVVGVDPYYAELALWHYPAGGPALKRITGLYEPLGVAVSLGR